MWPTVNCWVPLTFQHAKIMHTIYNNKVKKKYGKERPANYGHKMRAKPIMKQKKWTKLWIKRTTMTIIVLPPYNFRACIAVGRFLTSFYILASSLTSAHTCPVMIGMNDAQMLVAYNTHIRTLSLCAKVLVARALLLTFGWV